MIDGTRQVTRQLDILRTLFARRFGVTVQELADEYGVSKRTVQRDLRDLSEAGFALYNERRDGQHVYWYLRQETKLPPVNFPLAEVAALVFVEQSIDALAGTPFKGHLEDALRRITLGLPDATRDFLQEAAKAYLPFVRGQKRYEEHREILDDLNRALLEHRVCEVTYVAALRDEEKVYEIEPLRLFHFQGGLYLISRVPKHDSVITQAVERIRALKVLDETFQVKDELYGEVEERMQQAFGVTQGEPEEVRVWFPPGEAEFVTVRVWHPTQRFEEQADGSVILTFEASGVWEIKRWVLGFGSGARVLAPESLRKAVIEELEVARGHYEDNE